MLSDIARDEPHVCRLLSPIWCFYPTHIILRTTARLTTQQRGLHLRMHAINTSAIFASPSLNVTLLCTMVARCRRIFDGANHLHKTQRPSLHLASAILSINVAVHYDWISVTKSFYASRQPRSSFESVTGSMATRARYNPRSRLLVGQEDYPE